VNDWNEELPPVLVSEPSEQDLVQIALLMRLYDIGMAILTHLDEDTANELYEHHENKGHNNPDIFIPGPVEE